MIEERPIEFFLKNHVIQFGRFRLSSGRISPYYFDCAKLCRARTLATIGKYYAEAIIESGIPMHMLFGPAYKGIPLVLSTALALDQAFGRDVPWCFNRKEPKDHGDQCQIVGNRIKGNIVIIDDTITSGDTIRNSINIIRDYQAEPTGIVIAFDRMERSNGGSSPDVASVNDIEREYGIPVISIANLNDLISYLTSMQTSSMDAMAKSLEEYRLEYGVS